MRFCCALTEACNVLDAYVNFLLHALPVPLDRYRRCTALHTAAYAPAKQQSNSSTTSIFAIDTASTVQD